MRISELTLPFDSGDRKWALHLRDIMMWYSLEWTGDGELAVTCCIRRVRWWNGAGAAVWMPIAVRWMEDSRDTSTVLWRAAAEFMEKNYRHAARGLGLRRNAPNVLKKLAL